MESVAIVVTKKLSKAPRVKVVRLSKRNLELLKDSVMHRQVGPTCWFEVFTATIRAHVNPTTLPAFAGYTAIKNDLQIRHNNEGAVKIIAAAEANHDLSEDQKEQIKAEPLKRHHIAMACFGASHVLFVEPKKYTLASIGKRINTSGPFYASYYPYPKASHMDNVHLVVQAVYDIGDNATIDEIVDELCDEDNKIDTTMTEDDVKTAVATAVHGTFLHENVDKSINYLKSKPRDAPKGTPVSVTVPDGPKTKVVAATKPTLTLPWGLTSYSERGGLSESVKVAFDAEILKLNGRSWGTGAHAMLVVGVSDTNKCLLVRNPQNPTPLLAPRLEDFVFTGQGEGLCVGFSYKP